MKVDESTVASRQKVVDNDVHPLSELPKSVDNVIKLLTVISYAFS